MNRRGFVGGMSAAAASLLLYYVQPAEERIDTLEGEVQALDERVSALETQVADGGVPLSTPEASRTTGQDKSSSADEITVEGVGTTVSDKFQLSKGQYRVNATLQGLGDFASLTLYVHDPSRNEELVFNEFSEHAGGPWEGSAFYEAPEDGEYFVSVENTDAEWSIIFEPF